MTSGVKLLMAVNVAVFLVQMIFNKIIPNGMMEYIFGLSHDGFIGNFMLWQPFTYMFLHGGWMHIIFNLLGLWMFAGELELVWGRDKFIRYYLLSGIGAGFFIALMNYAVFNIYGSPYDKIVTIGASGAIYAILLAYAVLWPNREVLLYFLIPVKMKYLVLVFGLIEFFSTFSSNPGGGNISHIGHLGGIITGFLLIKIMRGSASKNNKKISFFENFKKKKRVSSKQKVIDKRIEAKKIIDELLGKIARNGMSSLTQDEKRKLEWARKHYYPSNDDILH